MYVFTHYENTPAVRGILLFDMLRGVWAGVIRREGPRDGVWRRVLGGSNNRGVQLEDKDMEPAWEATSIPRIDVIFAEGFLLRVGYDYLSGFVENTRPFLVWTWNWNAFVDVDWLERSIVRYQRTGRQEAYLDRRVDELCFKWKSDISSSRRCSLNALSFSSRVRLAVVEAGR
eukprot:1393407-Amorphochlora_amoeboformis.AAC.2